jgi:hypothetical protein
LNPSILFYSNCESDPAWTLRRLSHPSFLVHFTFTLPTPSSTAQTRARSRIGPWICPFSSRFAVIMHPIAPILPIFISHFSHPPVQCFYAARTGRSSTQFWIGLAGFSRLFLAPSFSWWVGAKKLSFSRLQPDFSAGLQPSTPDSAEMRPPGRLSDLFY